MASFTADDMRALLIRSGLNPVPADALDRTFAELGLDSLARIDIATRLQNSHGIDLEQTLAAGDRLTPGEVIGLVSSSASLAAG